MAKRTHERKRAARTKRERVQRNRARALDTRPATMRLSLRSPRLVIVVAISGYVLLLATWGMGNPPYAAPDESAHVVRALGIGGGELIGERAVLPVPPGANRGQLRWIEWSNRFARAVDVPAGLSPAGFECMWDDPTFSAACQDEIRPDPYKRRIVTY